MRNTELTIAELTIEQLIQKDVETFIKRLALLITANSSGYSKGFILADLVSPVYIDGTFAASGDYLLGDLTGEYPGLRFSNPRFSDDFKKIYVTVEGTTYSNGGYVPFRLHQKSEFHFSDRPSEFFTKEHKYDKTRIEIPTYTLAELDNNIGERYVIMKSV